MMQFGTLRSSYRFFILPEMWPTNLFIVLMLLVEWMTKTKNHSFAINDIKMNKWCKRILYIVIALIILVFGNFEIHQFIYFQF